MQKVVINSCYGGFGLSKAALKELGIEDVYGDDFRRDDPKLVGVVERLGLKANGEYAELSVVYVPNGVEWEIDEYDGMEHVSEKHRTWG